MAGYKLNTGGGTLPYKQANGTDITDTSTDVDGGVAKNVSDSENLTRSGWKAGQPEFPNIIGGIDNNITAADFDTAVTVDATYSETTDGFVQIVTASAHGLSKDQLIQITSSFAGVFRVVRVTDTTTFVINGLWVDGTDGLSDVTYKTAKGSFGRNTESNFIMMKNDATVHGQTTSALAGGGSDYGRSQVHKVRALRTRKVATAIRAGNYNFFSGTFTSTPSSANDYTSMDIDGSNVPDDEAKNIIDGYGVGGEITYAHGGRTLKSTEYDRRTT